MEEGEEGSKPSLDAVFGAAQFAGTAPTKRESTGKRDSGSFFRGSRSLTIGDAASSVHSFVPRSPQESTPKPQKRPPPMVRTPSEGEPSPGGNMQAVFEQARALEEVRCPTHLAEILTSRSVR